MGFTEGSIEKIAEKLRALPAVDSSKRELSKQEAVKKLADEIFTLQRKGYSLEMVTESLKGAGLEITTPTLRNYLQRAKPKRRKSSHRRSAAEPKQATSPTAAADGTKEPEEKKDEPAKKSGKDAFLAKDRQSY